MMQRQHMKESEYMDDEKRFSGTTVFMTGGSRGIGLAIAEKLARKARISPSLQRPPTRILGCLVRSTLLLQKSRRLVATRCQSPVTSVTTR